MFFCITLSFLYLIFALFLSELKTPELWNFGTLHRKPAWIIAL